MKIGAISADGAHLPPVLQNEPPEEVEKKLATCTKDKDLFLILLLDINQAKRTDNVLLHFLCEFFL